MGEAGETQKLAAERQRDPLQPLVLVFAGQEIDRVLHFDRVARGAGERLVHVGDQRHGRQAGAVRDRRDALRQLARRFERGHEGARAGLHVHHQAFEAGGEFFDRIEAVISATNSTVAVTSRMA